MNYPAFSTELAAAHRRDLIEWADRHQLARTARCARVPTTCDGPGRIRRSVRHLRPAGNAT